MIYLIKLQFIRLFCNAMSSFIRLFCNAKSSFIQNYFAMQCIHFSWPTSFLQKSSCRVSSEKNILNSSVELRGVSGVEWSGKIG